MRLPDLLGLPATQRSAAVPLLGLPARLQPDLGHPVRLSQAGDPGLPGRYRVRLRRGQGRTGAVARSRRAVQDRVSPRPQAPRGDGRGAQGPAAWRRRAAVEVDGCYVGGHVRPANRKADRIDRRLAENRSGRRQVIVVIRARALSGTSLGGTLPAVFTSEDAAASFIKSRVDRAS
ncbi:MAG: transposase, partial [Gemmatimonadales bacterium]